MKHTKNRCPPLLLALGALTLLAAHTRAGDDGVTRSHAECYPRSSDVPPTPVEQAPDGYGEENTGTGKQYDTNWLLDADAGDEDAVWMTVRDASISSGGLVVDADSSSGTRKEQQAWGEDRLTFSASSATASGGSIVVRNRLSVAAAWSIAGNGRNSAVMTGKLVDIYGRCHQYQNARSVSPTSTSTETVTTTEASSQSLNTDLGASEDGASAGTKSDTDQEQKEGATREITSTSVDDDTGHDLWELECMKTFTGTTCKVLIASAATLSLKAQALFDDNETSTEVTQFDLVNIVDAAYVEPLPPPPPPPPSNGGPGGPGGPTGPTTPGGGDGTGPATPGGNEPAGPTTPDDGDGTEPVTPDDEDADLPFVLPLFCGGVMVCAEPGGPGGGEAGCSASSFAVA